MKRAVVLTALPVEYSAVLRHIVDPKEALHQKGTVYEVGSFEDWQILIAQTGQGNPNAAVEAERAIASFSPNVLIFVGVAGGLKDLCIGDVVAAEKVYGYEFGKAAETFQPRPEFGNASYSLKQRAAAESKKPNWKQRIDGTTSECSAKVLVKPIAAGEKVVSSTRSETLKFLRSQYSDAVAVEMEGLGCLTACQANEEVRAIIIRGISDLIDGKEQSDLQGTQELAACHAAAFAFEILSKTEGTVGTTGPPAHPNP